MTTGIDFFSLACLNCKSMISAPLLNTDSTNCLYDYIVYPIRPSRRNEDELEDL